MIKKFKTALSKYPTGIACVLSRNSKNNYNAIIINSFSSVSLKPLMVLWSLDIKSSKFKFFKKSKKQIIVLLSKNQKKLVKDIAFKKDEISNLDYKDMIDQSIFSLVCEKSKEVRAGDHYTIFLKVKKILTNSKTKPLLYFQKKILSL